MVATSAVLRLIENMAWNPNDAADVWATTAVGLHLFYDANPFVLCRQSSHNDVT